jgi:thioesterase domain-containing protein
MPFDDRDDVFQPVPEDSLELKLQTYIREAIWKEVLGKATKVLVPLSEGVDGHPPFYCVHALSGSASALSSLAKLLGPRQPFWGIQAPTQKRHARFATSIEAMAEYYADSIVQVQASGKLALGGWSVGGIIALEIAQILRSRGRHDILLVNIDCELLNTGAGVTRWNPLYYWKVALNLPLWLYYQVREEGWSVRSFSKRISNKLSAIIRTAGTGIISGKMVRGHAIDGFMDTSIYACEQKAFMVTLYEALYRYVPKPYPGPVLIYEAMVQPVGHLRQIRATWCRIARPDIVSLMGTHRTIIREPDGIALAEHLRSRLARFAVEHAPDKPGRINP